MKFFRIEDTKSRLGYYSNRWAEQASGIQVSDIEEEHNFRITSEHPSPSEDSQLAENFRLKLKKSELNSTDCIYTYIYDYFFGFSSIEQFRAWFYNDDFLTDLGEDTNLVLSVYDVPDLIDGNTQAVINRIFHTDLNRIAEYNLADLVASGFDIN